MEIVIGIGVEVTGCVGSLAAAIGTEIVALVTVLVALIGAGTY